MSGIVGILHRDGSPVDAEELARLTSFLPFRGPDAQHIWLDGCVGFAHAALDADASPAPSRSYTEESHHLQPLSLDGVLWITADARLDARPELVETLAARGRRVLATTSDAELILHAYATWGEDCMQHLLGDFAFAVWDVGQRRLFCARDHFGVKPFFYAQLHEYFMFTNTLRCLRFNPRVTNRLNDAAIVDFLLFGFYRVPAATAFADIHRLPPAHSLVISPHGVRLKRYWTLPVEEPIRLKCEGDYVDEFRHLLGVAVKDRMPTCSVAVSLSGGLDSSTVMATAACALGREAVPFVLRGFTVITPRLFDDEEGRWAGLLGRELGIPVECMEADDYGFYRGWEDPASRPLEPLDSPFNAIRLALCHRMAQQHRVAMTGQGGDPVFSTSVTSYAAYLVRTARLARLFGDFTRFFLSEGRLSRLYFRTRLRVLFARFQRPARLPIWVNPQFAAQTDLSNRWGTNEHVPPVNHALRPTAYQALTNPLWPYYFEGCDPGTTGVPIQFRHPYFDLRLIQFILRIPPVPWCTDKELVRVAMHGLLPDAIRLRRKTPLPVDPACILLRRGGDRWWEKVPSHAALSSYVDWRKVPRLTGTEDSDTLWLRLAPVTLNLWLWSLDLGHVSPARAGLAGGKLSADGKTVA